MVVEFCRSSSDRTGVGRGPEKILGALEPRRLVWGHGWPPEKTSLPYALPRRIRSL